MQTEGGGRQLSQGRRCVDRRRGTGSGDGEGAPTKGRAAGVGWGRPKQEGVLERQEWSDAGWKGFPGLGNPEATADPGVGSCRKWM